jgi:hypothetical protein
VTHQKPSMEAGPNIMLRGLAVAILAVAVLAFGGLAVIDPATLVSLAPEWFAEPGTPSIMAGIGLAGLIAAMLYKAVREGNRGHEQFATWLTLCALLIVPFFSKV